MCGIIGYTGMRDCVPILLEGLKTLEYRGYDSAGITYAKDGVLHSVKAKGRLSILAERLTEPSVEGATSGIGHTRWATHGAPSDKNSHPHSTETLSLVHNGIIENYAQIGDRLSREGYVFLSDTDTERAAALLDFYYKEVKDPKKAIFRLCRDLRGSYAFGILFRSEPNTIYAIRRDSPLIVANTEDGCLISSDIPAILPYTRHYYRLSEGVLAVLSGKEIYFFNEEGESVSQTEEVVSWNVEEAKKGGYHHFMLKEIHEEPEALRKTVEPRIRDGFVDFSHELPDDTFLGSVKRLHIVACGTAMHAGLVGKSLIERYARLPVNVEIASEFRYRDPILEKDDLVVLISQSGETADTLAALRHAKSKGIRTLAIVNVIGSSVAREADDVLYTRAGPEIAVASTKAYSVQCSLLYLLALRLAKLRNTMTDGQIAELSDLLLHNVPELIERTLEQSEIVRRVASTIKDAEHIFYIGRDIDSSLCTEASLKLKEISYIHSEAYASGELKHGTISLVTDDVPVVALATVSKVCEKTVSGIREVKARGAYVVTVTTEALAKQYEIPSDEWLILPNADERILPFSATTVMQLLAYHVSALKGLDVDKPRNLAKSVTVE
ncbi:MAG: glutamine--fructose-6-phosphate transaminase (isomerizing) [Clostridia bacterium]|nr:glutamine--fructose-6-phosphate transaminase (isomerizing) [Clostridia bacterium]